MELDDLRRHWRQPEPAAPPALTARELEALLKGRTASLVEKMQLAARLETAAAAGIGLLCLLGLAAPPAAGGEVARLYCGITLVLLALVLGLYYRVLHTLGRMAAPTGSVRGHLGTLVRGLRQLLRFYYRLTLAAAPLMLAALLGFMLWRASTIRPLPGRVVAVVLAGGLVFGAVVQVGLVYLTRWYVQRVYGRHLDRLDSQLRELDEAGQP